MKEKNNNYSTSKTQSIVEYMIEHAPVKKTKSGSEKKILREKLLKKYGR
jgi:hypothetical protein